MTGQRLIAAAGAALALAPAGAANAACASDEEIARFIADFDSRTPTEALAAGGTMADARCTADKLRAELTDRLGPVVGHKAGLTSDGAMEAFGVDEPVRGLLYRDMLLEDGATVPEDFGARPLFEADLVLVVADAAINEAETPEGAMAHVSAVHPFIELPDLMYAEDQPLTGVTVTAGGVGPRLGVLGEAIEVAEPAAMAEALAEMTVRVTAADGEVMAEAPGALVLGNPVNSVLWLTGQGVTLAPGDLISVGSISPLLPPGKAGGQAEVTYDGLPGTPSVSVTFE